MATTVQINPGTTLSPIAGSFAILKTSNTGLTGPREFQSTKWAVGLPGTQAVTWNREWLVPYIAGTSLSAIANAASDLEGERVCVFIDQPGTLSASCVVKDADGTESNGAQQTQTYLGYDSYTTVHVDVNSTATNGVPYQDAFDDASVVSPTTRDMAVSRFLRRWSTNESWQTTGTGFVVPVTADAAGRSVLSVDAFSTEVDVSVTINLASITGTLHGVYFRGTGAATTGLWAGIAPSANQVQFRSNAARNTVIASSALTISTSTDYTIRVYSDGSIVRVWVNGTLHIDTTNSSFATNTRVGIQSFGGTASNIRFKDLSVTLPSEGDGSSVSNAISNINLAASIGDLSTLDAVRFFVQPGEYDLTRTINIRGDRVLWQAADYTNRPVLETAGSDGGAFEIFEGEFLAASGFDIKFTGNTATSSSQTALRMDLTGSRKCCGFDRCRTVGADLEFGKTFGGTFTTGTDGSTCLSFVEGTGQTYDHSCAVFGLDSDESFLMLACRFGNSSIERSMRTEGNHYLGMIGCRLRQTVTKNSLRVQKVSAGDLIGNAFLGHSVVFGGNDGTPNSVRMEKNLSCRFEFSQASNDTAAKGTNIALVANLVNDSDFLSSVATSLFDCNAAYENIYIMHNTFVLNTMRNDLLFLRTSGVAGGSYVDTETFPVYFYNNLCCYSDGGTATPISPLVFSNYLNRHATLTIQGNQFPVPTQTTGNTDYAWSDGAGGTVHETIAQFEAIWGTTNNWEAVSVTANMVPSTTRNRTVPNGVHQDFFGQLMVPGDTAWAGAVALAPVSSGTPQKSAFTTMHLITRRRRR